MMIDNKFPVELDNLELPRINKSENYQISESRMLLQNAEYFFFFGFQKKRTLKIQKHNLRQHEDMIQKINTHCLADPKATEVSSIRKHP